MKPSTIKKLQHFVGKVCTVIMPGINRGFTEEQARDHFVTLITEINEDGVFGTHPYGQTVNFYSLNQLISIHEEEVLYPNDPQHSKVIEEIEKKIGRKIESDIKPFEARLATEEPVVIESNDSVGKAPFVDIQSLSQIAQMAKKRYDEDL